MKAFQKYHADLLKMVNPVFVRDAVPMEVTPAARWFLAESPQEYWDYRQDFPCIVPPAPITWIEFQLPPFIQAEKERIRNDHARTSAAMIMNLEIRQEERIRILKEDGIVDTFNQHLKKKNAQPFERSAARFKAIEGYLAENIEVRWMCFWQLFVEPIGRDRLIPYVAYGFYLDQNGKALGDLGLGSLERSVAQSIKGSLSNAFSDVLPFFFALSLSHCRNVEIVDEVVPPAVAKKRKEKGIPDVRFKQLLIKPVGGKKTVSKSEEKHPTMLPLHFVRAHFREYTKEKPLFGKWVGRYFFHMHARGSRENGEIVKSYQVATEEKPNEKQESTN